MVKEVSFWLTRLTVWAGAGASVELIGTRIKQHYNQAFKILLILFVILTFEKCGSMLYYSVSMSFLFSTPHLISPLSMYVCVIKKIFYFIKLRCVNVMIHIFT